MYKAVDVARYVVNESIRQDKILTHVQIHGLLIVSQISSLLANDRPLFLEDIVEAKYFPHVEDVPSGFAKQYGTYIMEPVTSYEELVFEDSPFKARVDVIPFKEEMFSEEDISIINDVIENYGNLNLFQLKKTIFKYDELFPVIKRLETK